MLLRKNKKLVVENFLKGQIDELSTICPTVVDRAIEVTDKKFNIFQMLAENFNYCNMHEDGFKPEVFLLSMISAKAKKMFAISDVGMALTSPYALEKLNIAIKSENDIMTEGNVRNFINKVAVYEDKESKRIKIKETGHLWIEYFNKVSRDMLEKSQNTEVHILDCVKIPVNLSNSNYELSTVISYEGKKTRGYKLGVLRRVTETGGMIEYIIDGKITDHDLKLVEEEVSKTDLIKEGEYLIMDRGFVSISFITNLAKKGIHVVIPAKKNMTIYQKAREEAIKKNDWKKHPNLNREGQEIALITDLKGEWIEESDKNKKPGKEKNEEIDFNACVIRIAKNKKNEKLIKELLEDENEEDTDYVYIVILSTDTEMSASKIIRTYEQRTEIEEDFRQIKDQWDLATFTSTKYNYIMCHISMLLLGYNIFSLYKSTEEGSKYINRSMKSIQKEEMLRRFRVDEIFYFTKSGSNFCILTLKELLLLYGDCNKEVQQMILEVII